MAILAGDVQLVKSSVMDDVPEGGGSPTAIAIADGASNSIFNDISEADRAGGRVNLRKLFASIGTLNTDVLFGQNFIVAEPPSDSKVSITLFYTGDVFDTRNQAKSRIESYLSIGARYSGYLFGKHIAGQRIITLLQREQVEPPAVGDTLVLRKNEDQPNQTDQYVKIIAVASHVRTFTDDKGDFTRLEVNLTISDALTSDFNGLDATRYESAVQDYVGKTRIYKTIVADAARYFGVSALAQAARLGDLSVKAAGIFTQLVPSTKIEVPIADARMNQRSNALYKAGEPVTLTINAALHPTQALYLGTKFLPGTLSIKSGAITLTDKGGTVVNGDSTVGSVDYDNSVVTLNTSLFGTGLNSLTVTFAPAAAPTSVSQSVGVPVTAQGQRANWVFSIDSIPTRGSLMVHYRAMNRWYVLSDDGSGAVRGSDSSFGAGVVNYSTGSVSVTLGALPDVGSQIIVQWCDSTNAQPLNVLNSQSLPMSAFGKRLTLNQPIKPGTVQFTWNDGQGKTATDANGLLGGDATGTVDYQTGAIFFCPKILPTANTQVNLTTSGSVATLQSIAGFIDAGANWTFDLVAGVKPRSLSIAVGVEFQDIDVVIDGVPVILFGTKAIRLYDDGAGNVLCAKRNSTVIAGTIDYVAGRVSLKKQFSGIDDWVNYYSKVKITPESMSGLMLNGASYSDADCQILNARVWTMTADWQWWQGQSGNLAECMYATSDGTGSNSQFLLDALVLPVQSEPSAFNVATSRHVVANNEVLRDFNHANGTGTKVGTIGNVAGQLCVSLTSWLAGSQNQISNLCGLQAIGTASLADSVTFRTAIAPLFNGGFTVIGTRQDGTGFNVTPDVNGIINSNGVLGNVDYNNGIATLRFGTPVDDSHAADPGVVDLSNLGIAGVKYVKSQLARIDTLRYNAVGFSYLPLDANLLGLDPVRLPTDGKVPIFRAGGFVVIGHTGTINPGNLMAGQTIDCGRVRLSRIRVIGANGQAINNGFTYDLEAGRITFTDVSGYSQPVKIEHRIEDMALVLDAQINGQITLSRPLTHDYPLGSTISSALMIGDTHARVSVLFDQATFANKWQDTVDGNEAVATFNSTLAPIQVTNKGALTERWAIRFTNTTSFDVIGEHVGIIASGNTTNDCSPINPAAGAPYFTLPAIGWGSGWLPGNVLRFNTVGATNPVWVVRTILQGSAGNDSDKFTLLVRGDVDRV